MKQTLPLNFPLVQFSRWPKWSQFDFSGSLVNLIKTKFTAFFNLSGFNLRITTLNILWSGKKKCKKVWKKQSLRSSYLLILFAWTQSNWSWIWFASWLLYLWLAAIFAVELVIRVLTAIIVLMRDSMFSQPTLFLTLNWEKKPKICFHLLARYHKTKRFWERNWIICKESINKWLSSLKNLRLPTWKNSISHENSTLTTQLMLWIRKQFHQI